MPTRSQSQLSPRVGYVVKRYPRFSETFIVNELLAHERAGLALEVFSLKPPCDTHFQPQISRVHAPVTYLTKGSIKGIEFWDLLQNVYRTFSEVDSIVQHGIGTLTEDVFAAMKLAMHVKSRGITHLHAHFATSAATVTRLAAQLAGISYSVTAHAKDIFHQEVDTHEFSRIIQDADHFITVSDFNENHLRQEYPEAASRILRIYNGINLSEFPFREPRERPNRIVTVGRLVPKKGFADLIEACAILRQLGEEFSCEIVGEGELEDNLRRRIDHFNLQKQVQLIGPRPQNDVIQRIHGSALFVAPCIISDDGDRDGLPTVLLEAMALGTPCIATDVTGIPEVIESNQTGIIVPQHDPARIATEIRDLLHDDERRVRLAAAARTRVEIDFDVNRNAAFLRSCFRKRALAAATPA